MKYLVAVSGGVDSVVLLDLLVRENRHEIVVAHFDHGIRGDSAADARFVEALARKYDLPFETRREGLGSDASENDARNRRYAFLREMAQVYDARIVTAHHLDDLVETIVINFERGTGWRGLAVLGNPAISRPLLGMTKAELYIEAVERSLEWVEDSTNSSDRYLRNRVRKKTISLPRATKQELYALRNRQITQKTAIEGDAKVLDSNARYFFIMTERQVALELLRMKTEAKLTRLQLETLLHAIKTARPNTKWQAADVIVTFSLRNFTLEMHSQR